MRNNRKKLRKFIEKERVLWYLRRGGVYFEDVNGEKEMSIVYIDTKNYTSNDLQELFQSVGWLSANYPERLKKALDNSETVFTVWDGEKLVGLVNAIDDSELTAYVHYLCVNPEYQGQGIGKNLLQRIKEKYKNYIVCYCHNIYLDDIVKIVKNTNESNLTKKDILNLLNTNHFEDCKHLNPTGENCDILFKNAIQFAYNQKEKGEK